ncbi:hypothetical protein GCM10009680_75780 [Streptomyces yatensis]|uniref:Uncharacterized protein n=1 Tax=Streptomyces yatensis TaxID=155177 RepID=A0ABP4VH16_9ACTN
MTSAMLATPLPPGGGIIARLPRRSRVRRRVHAYIPGDRGTRPGNDVATSRRVLEDTVARQTDPTLIHPTQRDPGPPSPTPSPGPGGPEPGPAPGPVPGPPPGPPPDPIPTPPPEPPPNPTPGPAPGPTPDPVPKPPGPDPVPDPSPAPGPIR